VQQEDAQGWFRDPFGVHEDRYFSAGQPTKLVRDHDVEAYDEPPDRPFALLDLVPVAPDTEIGLGGSDLLRADDAERHGQSADLLRADEADVDEPYSAARARRAAMDSVTRTFPPF
jgi:hypothetical protein